MQTQSHSSFLYSPVGDKHGYIVYLLLYFSPCPTHISLQRPLSDFQKAYGTKADAEQKKQIDTNTGI